MKEILAFLAMFHCHVTEAQIVYVPGLQQRGFTHHGKAYVYSKEDSAVMVHELYHLCQKPAMNFDEWQANEDEAHRIEMKWRSR